MKRTLTPLALIAAVSFAEQPTSVVDDIFTEKEQNVLSAETFELSTEPVSEDLVVVNTTYGKLVDAFPKAISKMEEIIQARLATSSDEQEIADLEELLELAALSKVEALETKASLPKEVSEMIVGGGLFGRIYENAPKAGIPLFKLGKISPATRFAHGWHISNVRNTKTGKDGFRLGYFGSAGLFASGAGKLSESNNNNSFKGGIYYVSQNPENEAEGIAGLVSDLFHQSSFYHGWGGEYNGFKSAEGFAKAGLTGGLDYIQPKTFDLFPYEEDDQPADGRIFMVHRGDGVGGSGIELKYHAAIYAFADITGGLAVAGGEATKGIDARFGISDKYNAATTKIGEMLSSLPFIGDDEEATEESEAQE